jgi:SAM-dependent methyltransferase
VRPGDTIVDLGSGTGILALAAARAGAKKVYAIEMDKLIQTARRAAEANGLADRIQFIQQHSAGVTLPEKVDVIVSECLGLMGLGGAMIPAVVELAQRSLKEGGRLIPQEISLFLAPVESPFHYEYVHVWDRQRFYGFDFSAFQETACHNVYIARFNREHFVAEPQKIASIHLLTGNITEVEVDLTFSAGRAGYLHGFCGWFETDLGGGVLLSTSPTSPPTIWKQLYLPLAREVPLAEGSLIQVAFKLSNRETWFQAEGYFRWNTCVTSRGDQAKIVSLKQSTLKSLVKS